LLVHIGDSPKSNQAASLESQMIPTIQYVLGRALRMAILLMCMRTSTQILPKFRS
jgi:hypothetical protein